MAPGEDPRCSNELGYSAPDSLKKRYVPWPCCILLLSVAFLAGSYVCLKHLKLGGLVLAFQGSIQLRVTIPGREQGGPASNTFGILGA